MAAYATTGHAWRSFAVVFTFDLYAALPPTSTWLAPYIALLNDVYQFSRRIIGITYVYYLKP